MGHRDLGLALPGGTGEGSTRLPTNDATNDAIFEQRRVCMVGRMTKEGEKMEIGLYTDSLSRLPFERVLDVAADGGVIAIAKGRHPRFA